MGQWDRWSCLEPSFYVEITSGEVITKWIPNIAPGKLPVYKKQEHNSKPLGLATGFIIELFLSFF